MNILDDFEKKAFKIDIILSLLIALIILILAIFNVIGYLCILTFFLGVMAGLITYYHTAKRIHFTNYTYLKKTTTRLFAFRMAIYALVMILSYVIAKSFIALALSTLGILLLKISIYLALIKRKKDGKN